MALILGKIYTGYDTLFNKWGDPRTESWPLIGSPIPITIILGFYLYFVNSLGPRWMENRQPFKLKNIMIVYNAGQIAICTWIVYRSLVLAWGGYYKLVCQPVDFSESERALEIASCVYLYFQIKLTDLLDTVFFVLRKKNSHVSFLHVYHHTGMVVLIWSATKYLPGGHGTLLGVINSVVHIIMYGYYLLTLIDSKYKSSIGLKKHITQIQIVQFLLLVIHFSMTVITPNCEYPTWVAAVVVPQNLFMLLLFGDFYRKSYLRKPKDKSSENGNGFPKLENTKTLQKESNGIHSNGNHVSNGNYKVKST